MPKNSATQALLSRNEWMVPVARSISSFFYLGPWREPMVGWMARMHKTRRVETTGESDIVEIDREASSERLRKTGFSGTFRFAPELIDRVMNEIPVDFSGREHDLHLKSPAMRRIMYDPGVIDLVTGYLGVAPHVYQSELTAVNRLNRTQIVPGETCTKDFHFDVSDFRSLTLFVYLNDIESDGGAHVLIPSTHRSLTLSRYRSRILSYAEASHRYGTDRIVTITGPKGTAFLEDLVNWHKRSVTNRGRYCLSVTYTINRIKQAY
jgi:hypothetical protein